MKRLKRLSRIQALIVWALRNGPRSRAQLNVALWPCLTRPLKGLLKAKEIAQEPTGLYRLKAEESRG